MLPATPPPAIVAPTPKQQHPALSPLATITLVITTGLLFGISIVSSRFAIGQWQPIDFGGLQLFLAGVISLPVLLISRRRLPNTRRYWLLMTVWAILGTVAPVFLLTTALQYISSGLASLLIALNPAIIGLLAHLFLPNEPLKRQSILGIAVAFVGAGLLILGGESGLSSTALDWRGPTLVLIGVLLAGGGLVFIRRLGADYPAFDLAVGRLLIGGPLALAVVFLFGGINFSQVQATGYGILFYTAILGTFVPMLMVLIILQRSGALASAQVGYITPLAATLGGALLLGESLSALMLVAGLLILLGIYITNRKSP